MTAVSSSQAAGATQGNFIQKPQPAPAVEPVSSQAPVEAVTSVAKSQTPDNKNNNSDKEKEGEASKEAIKRAVADINKRSNGTEAVFGIHEETNRVTIKIVDRESKEVIKEVPAEKTLDLIAKVWEMAGIMVDEKR